MITKEQADNLAILVYNYRMAAGDFDARSAIGEGYDTKEMNSAFLKFKNYLDSLTENNK